MPAWRCGACAVYGGTLVTSGRQADRLAGLVEGPVEVGEWVELEPCVSDLELAAIERMTGRPCPRVLLADAALRDAAQLALLVHASDPCVGPYLQTCGGRRRQRITLSRAAAALADPRVRAALRERAEAERAADSARHTSRRGA